VAISASCLALALPASSVADPYADAASVITCPAGPSGWYVPPGTDGRYVLTPLTVSGGDVNEAPMAYGGSQVNVDCTYWTHQGGRLTVSVRYALPNDFNPFADFYIGCKTNTTGIGGPTGPMPWDNQGRLYRVLSPSSWSYATFYDAYAQLQGNEVGAFEAITRTMLKSAEPIAHGCSLTLAPTAPTTLWAFGFDANVKSGGLTTTGGTTGTFVTSPNQNGGVGTLGQLKANDFVIRVAQGSRQVGAVTIRVTQPVSFKYSYGAVLRALVQVSSSTYAPCHVGATGTLIVSTNTSTATLQVCHRNLIQGTGSTNAHISD
jgi:YD repeat-containing protein